MNDFVKKMLDYNRAFVEHGLYEKYTTTKYPDRKIAILACMDTRMTELLPAALGLKNGDVKLIKNAGGRVMHPYGSVIFSLLVAVYELGVDTVVVIGHDDCGGPSVRAPVADQRATEPLRGRTGGEFPFVPRRHAGPWARHAGFRQRACRRRIRRSCVAIGRRFVRGDRGIQYDSLCAPYRRPAHPDGHDPRKPDHGLHHRPFRLVRHSRDAVYVEAFLGRPAGLAWPPHSF